MSSASTSTSYDDTVALDRKLTEGESRELRIMLLPYFHADPTISDNDDNPEDINDLVDYALAMVSNNKPVGYITDELVGMEMKCCNSTVAKKVGNELSDFLQKLQPKGGESKGEEKGPDNERNENEPKKESDASVKTKSSECGNALTMSGALGASREGGRNNSNLNKGGGGGDGRGRGRGRNSNNKNSNERRQRDDRRGHGNNRGSGGRGRSTHREAFERLTSNRQNNNNRRRNSDQRGRGRGDDRHDDRNNNYDRRRRDEDSRDFEGRGSRGGRGNGRRDMHRGGRGRGRGDDERRGRGGRNLAGNRRSRDEFDEDDHQEPMYFDGDRGRGRGRDKGRGRGRGHSGGGGGRGRHGAEDAKRVKYDEYHEEEEYQNNDGYYDDGYGYGYNDGYYNDGYGGYDDHNHFYSARGRGRGRFGRGGRFGGRGRGRGRGGRGHGRGRGEHANEQDGNAETSQGDNGRGDEAATSEMVTDGQQGEQEQLSAGDGTATDINHPSPLVQASYSGRGRYGARGRFGRGRGRGRYSGRAHVVSMIQSKTWVRTKPDDENKAGKLAGDSASAAPTE